MVVDKEREKVIGWVSFRVVMNLVRGIFVVTEDIFEEGESFEWWVCSCFSVLRFNGGSNANLNAS